jgi:hypothetical protein
MSDLIRNVLNMEKCKLEYRINVLIEQIKEYEDAAKSLSVSLISCEKDCAYITKFLEDYK